MGGVSRRERLELTAAASGDSYFRAEAKNWRCFTSELSTAAAVFWKRPQVS